MQDFFDFLKAIGFVFGAIAFSFGSLFLIINYFEKYSCISYGKESQQQVIHTMTTGCMVKVDNTWKPAKNTLEIK